MKVKSILILFFIAPPVIIWILMAPLSLRFANFSQTMHSLGQISGLAGMSLFCLVFLLKTRIQWIDNIFSGLDKAYVNHHNIGAIAFMLLLFHPLFLAIRFIPQSTRAAALFLIPSLSQTDILFGDIALGIMIVLLAITFFIKLRYHIWKFSHKFLGIAFAFGFFHMMLIPSDISQNYFLRSYMIFLGLVSFISIFYSMFLLKRYKYEVSNTRQINENISEITLKPISEPMKHKPGQFAFFQFFNPKIGEEEHPFSIASDPKDEYLKIIVKNLGDYTKDISKISVKTKVSVEGPFGAFLINMAKNCIWIAGGIGITPFLGKINSVVGDEKIDMFYSVNEANEAVYNEELSLVALKNNNFKYHLWISREKGYLDAEKIKSMCQDFYSRDFYFCGPLIMTNNIKKQLKKLGIEDKKIHSEEFNLL